MNPCICLSVLALFGVICALPAVAQAPDTSQTPASAQSAAAATSAKKASTSQQDVPQNEDTKPLAGSIAGSSTPRSPSTAPAAPPPVPVGRPSIGLALGGGGAPAMSEIGALQWFEEHHIPVDMIAGTSMGCLVSALYSSGLSVDQLKHVMDNDVFNSVFRFQSSYQSRSFRRRQDSRDLPNGLTIGLKHRVSFRNSLLTDQGLNVFLDREFLRYDDRTEFNALPIPLRCLATDLNDSRTVTFTRGSLPDAVRASISIPGVYRPVELDGHQLVDGGVLENLPTQTIHAMHADVVLAVSLPLSPVGKGELDSIVGVLQRSFSVAIEDSERRSRALADVLIEPDVSGFTAADYLKSVGLAERGYKAAESHKAELLKYAVSDTQWAEYLEQRRARRRGPPGSVLHIRVKAPSDDVAAAVQRSFNALLDHPIDTTTIDRLLDEVRSDGRYDADYSVSYEGPADANPSVFVTVEDKKIGPPFLLLGANVEAQSGGVTRATIEGILLDQDLGGYGSELRTHIKAGFLTEVSSEYYRTLPGLIGPGKGRLFAAPRLELLREPFFIYQNQVRIAERQLETGGGGFDAGWTNKSSKELRLGWEMSYNRWQVEVGSGGQTAGGPDIAGTAQRARAQYIYDNEDRALVPQFGLHSVTQAGYLYGAPTTGNASGNAPYATTNNTYAHQVGRNLFVMGGQAGTLFNRNVAQPFRFTLGGPLKLSASAIDEYRGTDYYLVQPSFLRRIASLPAPLGQSLYLGVSYEAGQIYAPQIETIRRQDILFGVVAETPLGIVTLAPSIGDSGHRKFVFTLGKFF